MQKITFTDITGVVAEDYYPKPSKAVLPEWLKKLQPHSDGPGGNQQTGKKCVPMLDAAMTGYTILLTEDIEVTNLDGNSFFRWAAGLGIEFHTPDQLEAHSATHGGMSIPKWLNPWSIKTPTGYSSLFTPPFNNDGLPFVPFTGVVDTDRYIPTVNFPFVLAEKSFEGVVPAGTPIVQVFPFKREGWKMEIKVGQTEEIKRSENRLNSVFVNGYRNMFWSKKSYS
jgi:hypothetical protein